VISRFWFNNFVYLPESWIKFYKIHSFCYDKYNNDKVLRQAVIDLEKLSELLTMKQVSEILGAQYDFETLGCQSDFEPSRPTPRNVMRYRGRILLNLSIKNKYDL